MHTLERLYMVHAKTERDTENTWKEWFLLKYLKIHLIDSVFII